MNSIVEGKIRDYLVNDLHYRSYASSTILTAMRPLAAVTGHDLDECFAQAGLGAGPEARIASGIVDRALGGGGCETSEYAMRTQIADWLRRTPPQAALL